MDVRDKELVDLEVALTLGIKPEIEIAQQQIFGCRVDDEIDVREMNLVRKNRGKSDFLIRFRRLRRQSFPGVKNDRGRIYLDVFQKIREAMKDQIGNAVIDADKINIDRFHGRWPGRDGVNIPQEQS